MEQSRSDHFVPEFPSLSAEGADYLRRFILDRQDPRSDDTSYTGAFRYFAEPSGLPIASVITSLLTAAAFLAVTLSQSLWLAVVDIATAPARRRSASAQLVE